MVPVPAALERQVFNAIGRQKHIQGVNSGFTNNKHDIPMYADLYLQGRMNLDDLVSRKPETGPDATRAGESPRRDRPSQHRPDGGEGHTEGRVRRNQRLEE
jgi:hypothetical protein